MVTPAAPLVPGWGAGALGVEAAIGGDAWTLDTSRLDVDTWLGDTTGGWAALTCDVLQADWATGASRDDGVLTRTEAGQANLTLANPDRRYDPSYTAGPWFDRWRVGTPIRILTAAPPAAPVLVWSGTVDTIRLDGYAAGAPVAEVTAVDALGRANARRPVPLAVAVGAGESASARITRVLTRAGVPAAQLDIHAGGPAMGPTTHTDPPGVEAQQVAQAARWALWVGADGTWHAQPFLIDTVPVPPPDVTWQCGPSPHPFDVAYAMDPLQTRSSIDAQGASGNVQHVQDDGSLDRYSVAESFLLPLANDADVLAWATWLLGRTAYPQPRLDRLDVRPDLDPTGRTWAAVAAAALRQVYQVTIATHPAPTTFLVWVRGVGHRVTRAEWQTSYVTSPFAPGVDAGPWWTLDDTDLGRLGLYGLAPP